MNFAKEPYSAALIEEMLPLWELHHAETADKMYGPLNPDLKLYEQCDSTGALRIYTARKGGTLCGYQIFIVCYHIHSKEMIQATQDILFMKEEYRQGWTGYRFLKWCQEQLQKDGIHVVHQVISHGNDFGKLFIRMGYAVEDIVYSKQLQEVA